MTGLINSALVRTGPAQRLGTGFGGWLAVLVCCLSLLAQPSAQAAEATLEAISFASLPGDRVQLSLTMSEGVSEPLSLPLINPISGCGWMRRDQGLLPGQSLSSCDGRFKLALPAPSEPITSLTIRSRISSKSSGI